jgi:microcystin-dependent protein
VNQIPAHTHTGGASTANGSSDSPAGLVPARNAAGVPEYAATANTTLASGALLATGGTQPHDNLQPYLSLNFIICIQGLYPSRN